MSILVTGGAGYIGSHVCVELLLAGFHIVVFDNFSNSHPNVLKRIEHITGRQLHWVEGDIRDQGAVETVLRHYQCRAVMHFAGLKAVSQSMKHPLCYYDHNVIGTHRLITAMQKYQVSTLVFSSSATVYGEPQSLPMMENHPLCAVNPYGRSKLVIEDMLRDVYRANANWKIAILRYFNPAGAHESGLIGEDPLGIPNNLLPFVAQVAVGKRKYLNVWGSDYPTHDGTGVRDYIHVVDLALGHIKALEQLREPQCSAINLGAGIGYSVLDVVRAFENASGQLIPYRLSPRRPGDVAIYCADPSLAKQLLDWQVQRDLSTMCQDHWRWQIQKPQGYQEHSI